MRIRRAAPTLATVSLLTFVSLPKSASAADPSHSARASERHVVASKNAANKSSGKKKANSKHPALSRKPGSQPGEPDDDARHSIAGPSPNAAKGSESQELRAMRELDRVLFPTPAGAPSSWASLGTLEPKAAGPKLFTSGMPPSSELAPLPGVDAQPSLAWLKQLSLPDIPVRWDARLVRYLEFYRDSPAARSMVAGWIKKSGRYGGAIRRILRENGLPEDILWLALVESGFDPTIQSPAGAAGLWQFMPDGAKIYGLTVDRWVDERLDPERSTVAAARYLADLHQRFGSWELAFAAYNMGYGGLLAAIRKYNTNDFWELSRFEAGIPFETALYVPKIVAMAIVNRNRAVFGCQDIELDPPATFDKVAVRSGVPMKAVASAAGVAATEIEKLNPQILAGRTPPIAQGQNESTTWSVRVPAGTGVRATQALPKAPEEKLERYLVRWGESLEDIATVRHVSKNALASLNGVKLGEVIRPGTLLFVPATPGIGAAAAANLVAEGRSARPLVIVSPQSFTYADRRRAFYRVVPGDTLRDVANVLAVTPDELCRWNSIDPSASLHEGMTLQAWVPARRKMTNVAILDEKDARVLVVGSPEFFAHFEGLRGRKRLELVAKDGDNWKSIAKKYGVSVATLERINQRARSSSLGPGDRYVVYVPDTAAPPPSPEKGGEAVVAASNPAGSTAKDGEVRPASLQTSGDLYDEPEHVGTPDKPRGTQAPARGSAGGGALGPIR